MAIAEFSGIGVTALNGSVGDTTFARNAYGIYAKQRIGAPAGSSFLTAWQTEVGVISEKWSSVLTESNRKAWYTVKRIQRNNLGQRVVVSGFDLYMSINLNRFLITDTFVVSPPVSKNISILKGVVVTSTVVVKLIIECLGSGFIPAAIYATKGLPIGRMSTNQIYAFIGFNPINNVATPSDGIYISRLGALVPGTKVFIKLVPIDDNSGLRGCPVFSSVVIS